MRILPGKAVKCKFFSREMAYCWVRVHFPSPFRADTDYILLAEPQTALGKAHPFNPNHLQTVLSGKRSEIWNRKVHFETINCRSLFCLLKLYCYLKDGLQQVWVIAEQLNYKITNLRANCTDGLLCQIVLDMWGLFVAWYKQEWFFPGTTHSYLVLTATRDLKK